MATFRDDAWLSGFTAGEACFLISPRNRGRLAPIFAISLRVDDLPVLEALRAEFGGAICVKTPKGRDHAAASWQVARKADLAALVRYFDAFPLRAKKAADYAIWRRAVGVYCEVGSTAAELWPLRDALMRGRRFDAVDEADAAPLNSSLQLKLVS